LSFNELDVLWQRRASVHRSPEGVGRAGCLARFDGSIFSVESGEKEVLTAATNAVEFASR
jgi:hypothetical protein